MTVLIKDYESMEAFQQDRGQILASGGGVMVSSDERVEIRDSVELHLKYAEEVICSFAGEVVYVASPTVGIELRGEWRSKLESITIEETEADEKIWGKDSESVYHRIQGMSMTEKIQVAVRAGKEERRILMKSTHHQTHVYLLKNPKITTDEVSQMCRSPNITTEMLTDISNNADWMKHGSIKMSVIKNPKTPQTVVKKHIHTLNDNDLYHLARSEHVRESVSRMAKSVLASKGKRID